MMMMMMMMIMIMRCDVVTAVDGILESSDENS